MTGGRGRLGPNYWRLWSASAVSNLGDGVRVTALPLLAASITRDPVAVSGVFVAGFLPWLLLSLVSGALVDRWDRRLVMAWSNAFRAIAVTVLAAAAMAEVAALPLLYVVAFLLGTAETLFDNAAQAFMPQVVAADDLEVANGRLYAAEVVTNQFAGPPLGGVLFAVGAGLPFLLNSATFAVSALLIFTMRDLVRQRRAAARLRRLPAEIGQGLTWLWRHRLLRTLAIVLGVLNGLGMAGQAVFVLFALEILGLSEVGFGILLTSYAVGSVLGGLLAGRVGRLVGAGRALLLAILAFGGTDLVIGLTSDAVVVGAMFALNGFFGLVWNVITVSLRQTIIPQDLLGRVNSVYRFVGWGSIPIGGALGGVLAGAFGLRAPFLIPAAVFLATAFAVLPVINDRTIAEARAAAAGR